MEAKSRKEMGSKKRPEFPLFAFHLTAATKYNPWKKLLWGPRKFSIAKKLKKGLVRTQGDSSPSTKLANCSENTSNL
jgi:hypothetical protein